MDAFLSILSPLKGYYFLFKEFKESLDYSIPGWSIWDEKFLVILEVGFGESGFGGKEGAQQGIITSSALQSSCFFQ